MRDGHRNECKACNLQQKHKPYIANPEPAKQRVREWQLANAERYQENQRRWKESGGKSRSDRRSHLKRTFGLTPDQYDVMLQRQGGTCLICEQPPAARQWFDIDHDHRTGRARGLLCRNCNQGLGSFREDPFLRAAAAGYLIMWDEEDPREFPRVRLAIGGEPRRMAG
jgi:hypothetical protein